MVKDFATFNWIIDDFEHNVNKSLCYLYGENRYVKMLKSDTFRLGSDRCFLVLIKSGDYIKIAVRSIDNKDNRLKYVHILSFYINDKYVDSDKEKYRHANEPSILYSGHVPVVYEWRCKSDGIYNYLSNKSLIIRCDLIKFDIGYESNRVPNHFSNLNNLWDLATHDILCDISFNIDDKIIKCHKLLLFHIPYFKNILFNGMMETNLDTINITDCDYELFQEILHYFYVNSFDHRLMEKRYIDVFIVSDKYCIDSLKYLSEWFIMENVINLHNFLDLYLSIKIYPMLILNKVFKHIAINYKNQLLKIHNDTVIDNTYSINSLIEEIINFN